MYKHHACISLAKNIHRQTQAHESPLRNENFIPGRMAYVFTLYDEYAEVDDIPTTLMRSKTDCPTVEVKGNKFLAIKHEAK